MSRRKLRVVCNGIGPTYLEFYPKAPCGVFPFHQDVRPRGVAKKPLPLGSQKSSFCITDPSDRTKVGEFLLQVDGEVSHAGNVVRLVLCDR